MDEQSTKAANIEQRFVKVFDFSTQAQTFEEMTAEERAYLMVRGLITIDEAGADAREPELVARVVAEYGLERYVA